MGKKTIITFIYIITLFGIKSAFSQQYHFSQQLASPLSINPSMTGYYNGSIRIASVYRSQWAQDANPYKTVAGSAEGKFFDNKIKGKLGLGILFSSDKSNGDALTSNTSALSAAYNFPLDEDGFVELGLGLQGEFTQSRLNPFTLTFENQFVTGEFNTGIATPELQKGYVNSYISVNAGMLLNIRTSDFTSLYLGAAIYHANKPSANFLNTSYRLPSKLNFQLGSSFDLSESIHLQLSSFFSIHQQSNEIVFGGMGLYDFAKDKSFQLGTWYRVNDAIIPYVGIGFDGVNAGLSYDLTGGKLQSIGVIRNSIELSLRLIMGENATKSKNIPWYRN